MKRWMKRIILIVIVLLTIVVGYLLYVIYSYKRLPDNLSLEVKRNGENTYFEEDNPLKTKTPYWIMSYNIGYGAYRPEYSFFMDGGKYSWGKDAESVISAVCGMGEIVSTVNPQFVFLQEVDTDGTRSFHTDQVELLNRFLKGYYYDYAQNYDSPFLMVPPWQPHGANTSGLVTYSRVQIMDSMRRSLPISESLSRLTDLDRCYSISRIPMENGAQLCLYNVHLTAFGGSEAVRKGQLSMLFGDMEQDYKKGNYVICGGDFNHNLRKGAGASALEWASAFPRESLPDGFRMGIDSADDEEDIAHDTCRDAGEPYQEDASFTVTVDGFIVSDNVNINFYQNMDWRYEFSDHDPVLMEFMLE